MLSVNQAAKTVEVEFEARAELLLNPMKQIQGGYLCAMLDECMSVACMVASGMTARGAHAGDEDQLLPPGHARKAARRRPGGQVGPHVAFTEGELYDAEGRLLAKATGTAIPTPFQTYKK